MNYYDILGIKEDATINDITSAKDRLKFGNPDVRAPFSMWSKIDEAYKVLSNPERRKEYNEKLQASNTIYLNNNLENTPQIEPQNFNNSIIPTLKKTVQEVVTTIPPAVISAVTLVKRLNKKLKYKLNKDSNQKTIFQIKTEDSKLIEEYRKKLEEKINNTLNYSCPNYNLQIDILKYENYIYLLKRRIEQKENQVIKRGNFIIYRIQLTSLRNQLKEFMINLENINKKKQECLY